MLFFFSLWRSSWEAPDSAAFHWKRSSVLFLIDSRWFGKKRWTQMGPDIVEILRKWIHGVSLMSLVVVIGYTFSVVLFKNRSNPFLHEPKPWICFAFPLQTVLLCKGGLFRSQLPSLLQQQTRGAAAHCNLDCTFSARLTTYCLLFLWLRSSFPPRHATCLFISPQQGRGLCLRKRCRQQDKRLLGNKKTRMMNFFWSPHTFSLSRK